MKALVFHDIGNILLEEVKKPKITAQFDAIVKITTSAICGTDLHFIRGTVGPMKKGTILGHEAVGIVEEVGKGVKNFQPGDRVIIPSTIACGFCPPCRKGLFSQCDTTNPNGPESGTAFYGGPEASGPFQGCQAEYVKVPYANNNLIKLPAEVLDDKAILLSDIFPTAYFAADLARVKSGAVVVILGCGPVGQFAIASCKLKGAARIFAIDTIPSRLEMARNQGAECIDFNEVDPIEFIKEATEKTMADVVIDAVGVDAVCPTKGPAAKEAKKHSDEFKEEVKKIAPKTNPKGALWVPGNAPSQALRASVELACKGGTISIIGVYPETFQVFPIGKAMNKNLKIVMGNCPHRKYIPKLLEFVQSGIIDPTTILTQKEPLTDIVEAYEQFDLREEGWIKVALKV